MFQSFMTFPVSYCTNKTCHPVICDNEGFEQYVAVNKLTEDTVPRLLSEMGPKIYGLLRIPVDTEKPKDKSIKQPHAPKFQDAHHPLATSTVKLIGTP